MEEQTNTTNWQGTADLNNPLQITAEDFIQALGYSGTEQVYCRVFDDTPAGDDSKAANRQCDARVFGSMSKELAKLNQDKRGVFLVICGGGTNDAAAKGKGKARAQFMEIDEDSEGNKVSFEDQLQIIKQFALEPSIIVKTAKSLHTYWLLSEGTMQNFRDIQTRLAAYFGGDPKIVNESRVMRLPGYYHCKGEPVLVQVVKFDPDIKYTQRELAELLPKVKQDAPKVQTSDEIPSDSLVTTAGGRHNAIMTLGGKLRRAGLNAEEIEAMLLAYNNNLPDPLPDKEITRYIKEILQYRAEDLLHEAQIEAAAADFRERMHQEAEQPADFISAFLDKVQSEVYKPLATGLPFFDNLLGGGVIRQTMLLLLAAPATGKTTLAQQVAEAMAMSGKKVLYLNLEMSREQMLAKAISYRLAKKNKAIITATEVLQGYKWTDEQAHLVPNELQNYRKENAPYITYMPGNVSADLDKLKAYLQAVGESAKEKGEDAPTVFCDYLHLIRCDRHHDPQQTVKEAVEMLKGYAIQYNTFAFVISASNRASNASGKLTMESGRDSSSIEYTGDYILTLNYTEVDKGIVKTSDEQAMAQLKSGNWRQMTLRVEKHRLGLPGVSKELWYRPAANIYYDAADFMPADESREKIAEQAAERARELQEKKRAKAEKKGK